MGIDVDFDADVSAGSGVAIDIYTGVIAIVLDIGSVVVVDIFIELTICNDTSILILVLKLLRH